MGNKSIEELEKENELLKQVVKNFQLGYENYITFEDDNDLRKLFHSLESKIELWK